VVISLETCARQAQETGWAMEELFDFFLIHGILHLLDYDHDTPEHEARMEAKSRELMGLLYPGISY
jgi:probable rRNA maturation factor